jgi:hypothetical protein
VLNALFAVWGGVAVAVGGAAVGAIVSGMSQVGSGSS